MTRRRKRQLSRAILSEPTADCALCGNGVRTPHGLEPTAICNLCAQAVALEFANDDARRP